MKIATQFRMQRQVVFGLMLLALNLDCLAAPAQCGGSTQSDFYIGMVVKPERALLSPSPTSTDPSPRNVRWLTRGDVVLVRREEDRGAVARVGDWPVPVCAAYRDTKGRTSYGWLRKDELLDVSDVESDFSAVNASLEELVAQLPSVQAWPLGGRTTLPVHYNDFTGSYFCLKRVDLRTRKLCVATTSRWFADDECGDLIANNRAARFETEGRYAAFLLNDAMVVISERGMWGNHGQSDPEGIYRVSESAKRYCEAEATGPALGPAYRVIVPGESLGSLSLRTIGKGSGSVEGILGKPTAQDIGGRILVYHSEVSGNGLLIDLSPPGIEFTSPYFVTSRGVAINNVEYFPQQFEKIRDEANEATRYNFRRGGLAFLIFDRPMQTKIGVISRLGMIGRDASNRSPALLHF